METVEREIMEIFHKRHISDRDVSRANELISVWKYWKGWKEDTSNPIKEH